MSNTDPDVPQYIRAGFARWIKQAEWILPGDDAAAIAFRAYMAGHFDGRHYAEQLPDSAACDACCRLVDADPGWSTRACDEPIRVWICPDCDHLIPSDQMDSDGDAARKAAHTDSEVLP